MWRRSRKRILGKSCKRTKRRTWRGEEVECWEEKEGIKERFYKEQKEKNDEDMEEKVVKEEEVKKLG